MVDDLAAVVPVRKCLLAAGAVSAYPAFMNLRSRKFVGTFLFVAYVTAYSLVVMALGVIFALGKGFAAEMAFYVIGGLAWLPGAMVIIRWMSKP